MQHWEKLQAIGPVYPTAAPTKQSPAGEEAEKLSEADRYWDLQRRKMRQARQNPRCPFLFLRLLLGFVVDGRTDLPPCRRRPSAAAFRTFGKMSSTPLSPILLPIRQPAHISRRTRSAQLKLRNIIPSRMPRQRKRPTLLRPTRRPQCLLHLRLNMASSIPRRLQQPGEVVACVLDCGAGL